MNPLWSMSTSSNRKRPDNEDKSVTGEQKSSPPRTSSGKKQLPSIPKNAVPVTKPISPTQSAQSTNGTHASYGPFYLEYSLLAEFTLVVRQKLPGVYVQPSYRSALMWFGVIFIRHGLYQDGVFKFTIYIPDNYPDGESPQMSEFIFSPWNPTVHEEAKEKMLSHKRKSDDQSSKVMHITGLSWVKPGSTQPFSKDEKTIQT
ncbi:AKT-interacting protein [Protopterus annectens]|uniref:AKT-interacting protein n=1 Tax=Protopterus annectens TaxID=7888 RepID=UPI001CF9B81F|nr:AKT-interacting protein [Protopterus annectens]